MVKITIKTDSAAFEGVGEKYEIARILRELADSVEIGGKDMVLFDGNIVEVGKCKIT